MSELSEKQRDNLDEDKFAFPKERKEPLDDASHVRNAIARFNQVEGVSDDERDAAWKRIKKAADKYGVEVEREELARDGQEIADRLTGVPRAGAACRCSRCLTRRSQRRIVIRSRADRGGGAMRPRWPGRPRMRPLTTLLDQFNGGDIEGLRCGACDDALIVDEFAPHAGPGGLALQRWLEDYGAEPRRGASPKGGWITAPIRQQRRQRLCRAADHLQLCAERP